MALQSAPKLLYSTPSPSVFSANERRLVFADFVGLSKKRSRRRRIAGTFRNFPAVSAVSSAIKAVVDDVDRVHSTGSATPTESTSSNPSEQLAVNLEDILAERGACGVGFIANLDNQGSFQIVRDALTALGCMEHRGGCGSDDDSGDGSGIMTAIPWDLFDDWAKDQGIGPFDRTHTGVGMVFLPKEDNLAEEAKQGIEVLGWRSVPTNISVVGRNAKETMPNMQQVFVRVIKEEGVDDIERELYICRKLIERAVSSETWGSELYFCSLSNQTIVYKGMLRSEVLGMFYYDLQDERYTSPFAIYHRRYSTNTSPRWPLAQPMRFLGHNGEINTIQGNLNWMRSREASLQSPVWRGRESEIRPYGNPKASDSANLDSAAELLIRSGRAPEEALMILVPEAYKNHPTLMIKYPEVADFYDYYKGQMETWDGPALLLFSDGKTVGACLDRNGLRPARYWRTVDNVVYVASEVGVLPMDESKVTMKGRLGPGMMISVDLTSGQVYENTEVKKRVASSNPYGEWVKENLRSLKAANFLSGAVLESDAILRNQQAFGYSSEDVQMVIESMASQGKEPTFCMGDDIPLAVMSQKPHMLYDYFKQRFAQVTNPAIDPLREGLVMSLEVNIGKRGNILEVGPENASQKGVEGSLEKRLNRLCEAADEAVRNGSQMLVLSDRSDELEPTRPAIPILLAVGAVHHHLIQNGLRTYTSIVVDTAQCFSTHQFACLIGYGASVVDCFQVLRDLLEFKSDRAPIPVGRVEPATSIVERFCTGGMSLGAISRETHEAIAIAMNRLGGKSNSGEGGEDPIRWRPLTDVVDGYSPTLPHLKGLQNGDTATSAIKQVASGRFGVTPTFLVNADQLEIKIAQGAKPGEGGQLPGKKVSAYIARLRNSKPGVPLISPPPHHDIYSIEDLAQLIYDLHQINPKAKVSVKLVAEAGIGTVASGVAKGNADIIQVSGHDGGTGASPISSIKHAGGPWELGLTETNQTLIANGLRERVILRVDGGLKSGVDVMMAAAMGADEYGFGSLAMIATGCVMARICHTNNCPVGVASQREELRARFPGVPGDLVNYFLYVAEEVRGILAQLGFEKLDDVIGRTDILKPRDISLMKTQHLDLNYVLSSVGLPRMSSTAIRKQEVHTNGPVLDDQILSDPEIIDAIENEKIVNKTVKIFNVDRAVCGRVAGVIAKKYGDTGFAGQLNITFEGSAGQSFAVFLTPGMNIRLVGEANDYVGKGMAGGELIVTPAENPGFCPEEATIVGNTCLYGATGGQIFVRGKAGERFAVRNSLAEAVVEGTGDHCCEYMTGGCVVILGKVGRNVAAGMTGGLAYILDEDDTLIPKVNKEIVKIQRVTAPVGQMQLKSLIEAHVEKTGSSKGAAILKDWDKYLPLFWQLVPPSEEDTPEASAMFEQKSTEEEATLQSA
uniref:glutamate synthase (ferredoxin) n=1 Tax=Chenopodium quinoa TaxID=63459 RepID=A0A803LSZ8_CHEQI